MDDDDSQIPLFADPDRGVRKRIQIDFSKVQHAKLTLLKKETGVKTLTRVIRIALNLLAKICEHKRIGWKVILRSPAGEEIELIPEETYF